jgi:hypothetical protein
VNALAIFYVAQLVARGSRVLLDASEHSAAVPSGTQPVRP